MTEADIVTLAIECKSRNAESSLNAFNQKLNQSSTLAGEVMKSLGLAFGSASVIAYMKRAAAASMAFNRELYNIKSIASELDLSKVRSELLSLDSRLGSAADNAGALYFAYSSGVRGTEKELVKFTGEVGKLSQAIVADQIPTMDAVTSIMNAYGKTANDVTEISDMFFQVVKQGKTTGSSFANVIGSVAGVAANAGVSLNDLGNAAATLTTTMPTERAITSLSALITAFIKPTDEATKVAQKYGIELSAAALKSKGLSGVLAEMHSKVGTNTEAIAQIVPSIEGMRAAVALAGGQYKMFADNMEIFKNKAGSSAQAFAAQAQNLDKQIASLPDTFNKISIQVGESAKNILTLNGALTPLLASFNNMDKGTQKLIADLTLLAGGYVMVKGAVAAINTIKTIQLALQAKATAATAADTVATGANTTALNAQNAALAKQIALLKLRDAAGKGKTKGGGSGGGIGSILGGIGGIGGMFGKMSLASKAGFVGLASYGIYKGLDAVFNSDWFAEMLAGAEFGTLDEQRKATKEAEDRKKAREAEALEKPAKDQEKATKDQLKAAAQQEKNADIKALNETVNKYRYSKLSIQEQIQYDKGRIGAINVAYGFAESAGNAKRQNELLKEKIELQKKIEENENRIKESQERLKNIYVERSLIGKDYSTQISAYELQMKNAEDALKKADAENLKLRNPDEYLKLTQDYFSKVDKLRDVRKNMESTENQLFQYQLSYENSSAKKREMLQHRFNELSKQLESTTDEGKKASIFGEMHNINSELKNLVKNSMDFTKGLQTAFQAVEYGTAQAAQAESRRYYKSAADEYAKQTQENTKYLKQQTGVMVNTLKSILEKIPKEGFVAV